MFSKKESNTYAIGIDGGGTKTIAILANKEGKIIKQLKIGSTNPNKIGFEKAVFYLRNLIKKVSKGYRQKIKIAYIGLAGGLERDRGMKEKIKNKLQKYFPFKIEVNGDQKIAFRAGTNEKNGIVIIAGTGAIAMGWKDEKEAISGGWDWLIGDQGSAFWIGKKVLEEVAKSIDNRRRKMKIVEAIFKKFKIKKEKDFYRIFYSEDFVKKVALISKIADQFSKKGDKFSKEIFNEAARELSKMAISVVRKLNFQKEKIPMVLSGGMWKSDILRRNFQKEIKKTIPRARFILPKNQPIIGAIKLAIEKISI